MYIFRIKENGPNLEVVSTRAILLVAAIASFLFRFDRNSFLSMGAVIVLLLLAIFTKKILVRHKVGKMLLYIVAAILVFLATRYIVLALMLVLYGLLMKYILKIPVLEVNKDGIRINKLFGPAVHYWKELTNVVLKDNLLTVDFKSNRLLQVFIEDTNHFIDEGTFNKFCASLINEHGPMIEP